MVITSQSQLHIFFFSFLARGHTLPMLEIAHLFADRGVRCTVISTPASSSYILPVINDATNIHLLLIPFPSAAVDLPAGIECNSAVPPGSDNLLKFFNGVYLLQDDFKKLVTEHQPHCIISDSTLYWIVDSTRSLAIPHYQFCSFSPFTKCVISSVLARLDADGLSDTIGPLTELPHPLQLTRPELHDVITVPVYYKSTSESEAKSRGVLFNSFDELAPEYVEIYRKTILHATTAKVFCVGPAVMQLPKVWEAGNAIKNWLDSKSSGSVIYISFGSECRFSDEQLREIALGLASCDSYFIWVVRGGSGKIENWLPEEFEAAMQAGKGLMITEWAPQVAILNHPATGGFLMHCGWSSVLEAVCAGLPVIAWPLRYDQFINERFVVEVMRIGVRILEEPEMRLAAEDGKKVVMAAAIKAAVNRLMGGGNEEELKEMRAAAKKFRDMATAAMAEGGSSYNYVTSAIEEIMATVRV